MRSPLVSIIVPVYNTKSYLKACLDSLLSQSYQNLEIILVDDGSTDGSADICNDYAKHNHRIKVIHQANQGLSAARNLGIINTIGEYLIFVDSDDKVTKKHVEHLVKLTQKYNVNLAITTHQEIYDNGKRKNFALNQREQLLTTAECLAKMLGEDGFILFAPGKIYHKSLFLDLRFPEGSLHEDVPTIYKTIMQCQHIAYAPYPDYLYYQRQGSITKRFDERKLDLIKFTDDMCTDIVKHHPELGNDANRRRMQARFSILRQIHKGREQAHIIRYLKEHQDYILKNPVATRRDKIAMRTLFIHPAVFQFSWKIYTRLFK